jgi:hypothetical protein
MKILLIAIHTAPSPQAIPLANAFLKAQVQSRPELARGVTVMLLDFYADMSAEDCTAAILAAEPDAVGFSMYTWNRQLSLATAGLLRSKLPGLTIFAGGPEPTADPLRTMEDNILNFIITGEGEIPFVSAVACLLNGVPLDGIAGIIPAGATQNVPVTTSSAAELDLLASPFLSGCLPADDGGVLWQLSRGCGFACDFCFDNKGQGGVRRFSYERLEAELVFFLQTRVEQVFVLDSTFNKDMKFAKKILRLIKQRAPHIHFHFEVRSEFLDRELAELFAGITCSLQIGLQSADPAVQKRVNRVFSPEDFINRIALLNESGAIFGFDLIYGLPGDTLDGFRKSLDFALDLYPNHLDIFPLAILPGTRLAERATKSGLDYHRLPPYTLISSPTMPATKMTEARQLATACDIFYSRGKAVAWFKPLIEALKMSPASFLDAFGSYLQHQFSAVPAEESLSDQVIWELQRSFIAQVVSRQKKSKLLPIINDLVDYHFHYGAALLSQAPELPTDRELTATDLLVVPLALASSARLSRFNYEILDIIESGAFDLYEFTSCFKATGSWAVIYPRADDVFTESLIEPYFVLLQRLNGEIPAGKILQDIDLAPEEAASFLEFAASEGIICLVK